MTTSWVKSLFELMAMTIIVPPFPIMEVTAYIVDASSY